MNDPSNEQRKLIEQACIYDIHSTKDGVFIGDFRVTNKHLRDMRINSKAQCSNVFYDFFTAFKIPIIDNIHHYMARFYGDQFSINKSEFYEKVGRHGSLELQFKRKYAKDCRIFINKYMCKMFGRNYLGQLNYLITQFYCEGINKEWLFSVTYRPGKPVNFPLTDRMIAISANNKRVLKILKQNEADNLNHLSPFILYFRQDPAGIKKIVGKKAWKAFCNNKITRNRYIVELWEDLDIQLEANSLNHYLPKKKVDLELIQASILIKSTVLKKGARVINKNLNKRLTCQFIYFCNNNKLQPRAVFSIGETLRDTLSMSSNCNTIFNNKWSINRLKNEHNDLIRKQIMHGMNEEEDRILNVDAPFEEEFQIGDVKVTYLNTTSLLYAETYQMVHCVYDYRWMVETKDVFVFHLEIKKDEITTTSTLMISSRTFRQRQHYGKYNADIISVDLLQAAKEIIQNTSNWIRQVDDTSTMIATKKVA